MNKLFELTGEYCKLMARVFRKPEKWRIFWIEFWKEADKLIIKSFSLVCIISIDHLVGHGELLVFIP